MLKDSSFETELSPYDQGLADGSSSRDAEVAELKSQLAFDSDYANRAFGRGFARAVQALDELAPSIAWAARAAEHLRGVVSLAPQPPVSDPIARMLEFAADIDQTAEEAEAELRASGVDVDAFLARVKRDVARSQPPVSDPEEAARERLGKWLAAKRDRGWVHSDNGTTASIFSPMDEAAVGRGRGANLAAAITAALDAAEATEGER